MKAFISDNLLRCSNPRFSSSLSAFNFRSSSPKSGAFFHFSNRKWCWVSRTPSFCSVSSSSSASLSGSYGGWDELKPIEDLDKSSKLVQFKSFLISLGVDDRKHVFMFFLGLVSALAISRVRISSVIVFPASVLVFAVGFSLGFVRGGGIHPLARDASANGSKKTSKEENYKVTADKLRKLVDFFSELSVKLTILENEMKETIDSNRIESGQLGRHLEAIQSISLSILPAKSVLEASVNSMDLFGNLVDSGSILIEDGEVKRTLNQKPGRRRKETSIVGFDFLRFLGGLFQENSVALKYNKVKDNVKPTEPLILKDVNDQAQGNILMHGVEEEVLNPISTNNVGNTNGGSSCPRSNSETSNLYQDGTDKLDNRVGIKKVRPKDSKLDFSEMVRNVNGVLNTEEFIYRKNNLRFMNNHGTFLKMVQQNTSEIGSPKDNIYGSVYLDGDLSRMEIECDSYNMETKTSFQQEQTLNTCNGGSIPSRNKDEAENRTYRPYGGESLEYPGNNQCGDYETVGSTSSSSMISEDVAFDRHLTEATDLLKQARKVLKGKGDEERAEIMLYKSARLLSRAIAMKPMSLLAVGQLGNTFLLHGELKLKISRELRTLLSKRKSSSFEVVNGVQNKGLNDQVVSKDRIASVLIDVCEECEQLLVEAGRKYRMALSIDGNDVRSLYNWGLALSFRAQLIADIGPEAAFDADKVYLAAIDKFDAMMSRSNSYAPDALFRWGLALQQRSRLRPNNAREKMKLLQQAKRLFEDALNIDSDNLQVREALSSCMTELNVWE
ncbi:PREDICTED: uncharacterized protein LOC104587165 [Nelumbo nucifera]|uniref:Uncharacterized protein LOC104587165 n=2 Tax=Nelumbo nucifera TaxID=4432 RepID=A0A1U7YRX8_NELNU|nr:PREDICTED: uncharacterized protein LOC104587165 [Nelumbo nucifera]DAD22934.1 TPA_asm: hypothetical protein HUJ06_024397 [Nelumbo nucifera]